MRHKAEEYYKIAKRNGVNGNCVGEVRKAINDVYYGGDLHYEKFNRACNVGKEFLSKDKHFKKINVQGLKLNPKDVPAGVIVLYGPGYSNGPLSYCGHGEFSDGNGHGLSDCKTQLLKKEPIEIWIPI